MRRGRGVEKVVAARLQASTQGGLRRHPKRFVKRPGRTKARDGNTSRTGTMQRDWNELAETKNTQDWNCVREWRIAGNTSWPLVNAQLPRDRRRAQSCAALNSPKFLRAQAGDQSLPKHDVGDMKSNVAAKFRKVRRLGAPADM